MLLQRLGFGGRLLFRWFLFPLAVSYYFGIFGDGLWSFLLFALPWVLPQCSRQFLCLLMAPLPFFSPVSLCILSLSSIAFLGCHPWRFNGSPVWLLLSAPSLPQPPAFRFLPCSSVGFLQCLPFPSWAPASCPSLWRLGSSAGVRSPLPFPSSRGVFSLHSWPLLPFLLFALSLRFPSSICYPLMVVVGPLSLLRR